MLLKIRYTLWTCDLLDQTDLVSKGQRDNQRLTHQESNRSAASKLPFHICRSRFSERHNHTSADSLFQPLWSTLFWKRVVMTRDKMGDLNSSDKLLDEIIPGLIENLVIVFQGIFYPNKCHFQYSIPFCWNWSNLESWAAASLRACAWLNCWLRVTKPHNQSNPWTASTLWAAIVSSSGMQGEAETGQNVLDGFKSRPARVWAATGAQRFKC